MPELDRASIASIVLLGLLLLFLLLFLAWKMREQIASACCLPPADEVAAQEADSLMQLAQAVHSSNFATKPGGLPSNHRVSRGFDRLPAYIAAKIASKGRTRMVGSSHTSQQKGHDVEMAMQSPRQSRFSRRLGRQKGSEQWHRLSSEDTGEMLIGTAPEDSNSAQMQSSQHASPGSTSPALSEQYSIASCSYPPLPWPDLAQLEDGLPLSSAASGFDEIIVTEDLEANQQ